MVGWGSLWFHLVTIITCFVGSIIIELVMSILFAILAF